MSEPSRAGGGATFGWDDDCDEALYDCDDHDDAAEGNLAAGTELQRNPKSPARNVASIETEPMSEKEPKVQPNGGEVNLGATALGVQLASEQRTNHTLRLIASGRVLVIPPPVPLPLVTIDQLEAQQRDLLRLGQSSTGESTRRWMQSQQLLSEMSLFLHMNIRPHEGTTNAPTSNKSHKGDVCFADFVQWHSPADFSAPTSERDEQLLAARAAYLRGDSGSDALLSDLYLSSRMRSAPSLPPTSASSPSTNNAAVTMNSQVHLWWSLWNMAEPLSLATLKDKAYALHESVAVTLDWLENHYTLEELLRDVWVANMMNAVVPMVHEVEGGGALSVPDVSNTEDAKHKVGLANTQHAASDVGQLLQQLHRLCRRLHAPGHEATELHVGGHTEDDEPQHSDDDDDDEYVRMSQPSSNTATSSSSSCHQQHTLRTWTMQQAREQRALVKSVIAVVEQLECEASVALSLSDMLRCTNNSSSSIASARKSNVPPPTPVTFEDEARSAAVTLCAIRRSGYWCPARERQDSKEALTTGPTPCVAIPRTFWLSDISQRLQQTRIAAAAPKPTSMNDTMVHEQMLLTLPTLSLLQAQCHVVCAAQRPVEEGSATCPPLLQALHCCWDWRGSECAA
jgi:hypothetical protein